MVRDSFNVRSSKAVGSQARRWIAALMVCMVTGGTVPALGHAAQPQVPQPDSGGVAWSDAGIGVATMFADVVYVPVKFVYAALGGIAGGFAFVLTGGNTQVSNTIWRSALGGDYVLTPRMIAGQDPIHFSGPTQVAQPETATTTLATGASGMASGTSGATGSESPTGSSSSAAPAGAAVTSTTPIDRGAGPMNAPRPLPTPDTSIQ